MRLNKFIFWLPEELHKKCMNLQLFLQCVGRVGHNVMRKIVEDLAKHNLIWEALGNINLFKLL